MSEEIIGCLCEFVGDILLEPLLGYFFDGNGQSADTDNLIASEEVIPEPAVEDRQNLFEAQSGFEKPQIRPPNFWMLD